MGNISSSALLEEGSISPVPKVHSINFRFCTQQQPRLSEWEFSYPPDSSSTWPTIRQRPDGRGGLVYRVMDTPLDDPVPSHPVPEFLLPSLMMSELGSFPLQAHICLSLTIPPSSSGPFYLVEASDSSILEALSGLSHDDFHKVD